VDGDGRHLTDEALESQEVGLSLLLRSIEPRLRLQDHPDVEDFFNVGLHFRVNSIGSGGLDGKTGRMMLEPHLSATAFQPWSITATHESARLFHVKIRLGLLLTQW
jgi:hypothetical protein